MYNPLYHYTLHGGPPWFCYHTLAFLLNITVRVVSLARVKFQNTKIVKTEKWGACGEIIAWWGEVLWFWIRVRNFIDVMYKFLGSLIAKTNNLMFYTCYLSCYTLFYNQWCGWKKNLNTMQSNLSISILLLSGRGIA